MPESPETLAHQAHTWWTTSIIDVHPGAIALRGYDVRDLIGSVTFPDMVWLLLRGDLPTTSQSALLEAALVSAVDHGPHAPSIATSRMAVTCGLPLNGAIASAVNMLDDVHGGAGQQCMELYADVRAVLATDNGVVADEQAVLAATQTVVNEWRDRGVTYLPGYGHRFHPVDPRTGTLLGLVADAADAGVVSGEYAAIGRCVETVLARGRSTRVPMNVDGRPPPSSTASSAFLPSSAEGCSSSPAQWASSPTRGSSHSRAAASRALCHPRFPSATPACQRARCPTAGPRDRPPAAAARHSQESKDEGPRLQSARALSRTPRRPARLRPLRPHEHRGARGAVAEQADRLRQHAT